MALTLPEDEIEDLVVLNHTREKKEEQRSREAKALKEVEDIRAEKRKLAKSRQNTDTEDPPYRDEEGESRDIVAEKLGYSSGRQVTRAISAVEKIDDLEEKGQTDLADIVRGQLNNKSISAGQQKHLRFAYTR